MNVSFILLRVYYNSKYMNVKNKKQIISWCLFDFANSSYSAVIAAVIFPVYYTTHIAGNHTGLGDLWWGRAISLSMTIVAVTSPFMGGVADFGGVRKKLLFLYTMLCVTAVACFSVLQQGMVIEGFILIILANIGMEGGIVFYNSFLTGIAEKEYQGRVSAWGFATGYAGSVISLIIALLLTKMGYFSETWLSVTIFFLIFSIPAFIFLPDNQKERIGILRASEKGIRDTWNTFREIWFKKEMRRFLIAYLVYEDGVNTVIVFSSIFAAATLKFQTEELIALYLCVQITALIGAFLMAKPIDLWGPKKVVNLSLILWIIVSVLSFFVQTKEYFFMIACIAGIGLGTVQAASRAFFAQFIQPCHESEYFGVYSLIGKSSAIIGPLTFGYISSTYNSQRPAVLFIALFFLSGFVVMQFVKGGGPNTEISSR